MALGNKSTSVTRYTSVLLLVTPVMLVLEGDGPREDVSMTLIQRTYLCDVVVVPCTRRFSHTASSSGQVRQPIAVRASEILQFVH
jgi:hypothetical protein